MAICAACGRENPEAREERKVVTGEGETLVAAAS
jgi:hypothetical protein